MAKLSAILGGVAGGARAVLHGGDSHTILRVDNEHSIFTRRHSLAQPPITLLPFSNVKTGGFYERED